MNAEKKYWIEQSQNKQGPYTGQELRALAVSGQLKRDALIWKDGVPKPVIAELINGLFPKAASVSTEILSIPTPAEPKKIQWVVQDTENNISVYSTAEIVRLVKSGHLGGDALVSRSGSKGWLCITDTELARFLPLGTDESPVHEAAPVSATSAHHVQYEEGAEEGKTLLAVLMVLSPLICKIVFDESVALVAAGLLMAYSVVFLIRHIVRTGAHLEMFSNLIIVVILTIGSLIPIVNFICIPLLIIYTIYNIFKTFKSVYDLKWHLVTSIVLTVLCVGAKNWLDIFSIGYVLVTLWFCFGRGKRDSYALLLDVALMSLSAPLVTLMVISIVSGLKNLFNIGTTVSQTTSRVTQNVAAHVRSGINVGAYTREVVRVIPTTVTAVTPGIGAAVIGTTASAGKALRPKQGDLALPSKKDDSSS